jgi:hypothetical protein
MAFAGTSFAAAGDIAAPAFSDIAGHERAGDLTLMATLGIMHGDKGIGGPVRPDDSITRAEFCKMIVAGLGRSSTAAGLAGLQPTFKDQVPSWAWGWVNAAFFMGLVKGDDTGTFRANDPISYAEVLTVLVRSVRGHEAQLPAGLWPYNVLFHAVDEGFNGTVDIGFPRLPATRGDVAAMIYAMMNINRLDKDGKQEPGTAMLSGRVYKGIVTAAGAAGLTITQADASSKAFTGMADPVYIVGASDYAGLRGLNVLVVTKAAAAPEKPMFIQVMEAAGAYKGSFSARVDTNNDGNNDSLKFADGTVIAWNAADIVTLNQADSTSSVDGLLAGDACTVFTNAAGKATSVLAFRYNVTEAAVTAFAPISQTNEEPDITVGGVSYNLPVGAAITGAVTGANNVAVNDVVKIATKGAAAYHATNAPVIAVSVARNVVQGSVSASRTVYGATVAHYVTIGGVEYKMASGITAPAMGTTVKYALNHAGELFYSISITAETPFARVTGYTVYGDGTVMATVSTAGVSRTYAVANTDLGGGVTLRGHVQAAAQAAGFAWIKVNPLTNTIVDFVEVTGWGTAKTIVSNSGGNITLLEGASTYTFIPAADGIACYKADGTYVATAGLGTGTGYTLRAATLGTVHDFDGAADTIPGTLYQYGTP